MGTYHQNHAMMTELLNALDLRIACKECCRQDNQITFRIINLNHLCRGDLFFAKKKGSNTWRPVSQRPPYPQPVRYQRCWHFVEGQGCTAHGSRCSFARSDEEAAVWNFLNQSGLQYNDFLQTLFPYRQNLSAAERIVQEYPGNFAEICHFCFYNCPQQISVIAKNGMMCHSGNRHPWKPLLVFYQQEKSRIVFGGIRASPVVCAAQYSYCRHVLQGQQCWHLGDACTFAHSQLEMAVWTAEKEEGLDRMDLIRISQSKQAKQPVATAQPRSQIYCKVCKLQFSSQDSFTNHCSSLEHEMMIAVDTTTRWKFRNPPENINQTFTLCSRPSSCEYGNKCISAHSMAELQEWRMRSRTSRKRRMAAEEQGYSSYRDRLLMEFRNSSNEVLIMSETVPGVTVHCDKELTICCQQDCIKWNFKIESEMTLCEVALLKEESGATFSLSDNFLDPLTFTSGVKFCTADMTYEIPVHFKPTDPGLYEQWLVFDFDMRPVLLRKLKVRVGDPDLSLPMTLQENMSYPAQSLERWHRGNRFIIPYLQRREAEEELLKQYKPPYMLFNPKSDFNVLVTNMNYKETMHCFLYKEELAQEEVVSRLSMQGTFILLDEINGAKHAEGELIALVSVPYSLTPDTSEGYVLRRAVHSALIALPSNLHQQKVYEAHIRKEDNGKSGMCLQLSKQCCSDLSLRSNTTCEMELQFQIKRLPFCEMHKAIDVLQDVTIVVPDLKECCVPLPPNQEEYGNLNAKQQKAMSSILGKSDGTKLVPPLLIYGPFGTGKTFTLAMATQELAKKPNTKVLICTHTNSSADLYIKQYFHHYVRAGHLETTPLRIVRNGMPVSSIDNIVLQYCNPSSGGRLFRFPDRLTLDKYRVLITTAVTARGFRDLQLPSGYFSHILIDEASQMLECEALIPLGLADKGTRVVLAGDHMQMGPKLFSVDEDQHCNYILLNRLFHHYQSEQDDVVALKSRVIFNENYRSTKAVVDFVSTHFYVGKSDAIKASGNVPPHPQSYPLRFHHVRGECKMDLATLSWFNQDEINAVLQDVQSLYNEWPKEWHQQEQREICVLSEGIQIFNIREELRKRNLGGVTVESFENVQGKQFRAVVLTTVHTRDRLLLSSNTSCLDFFNNPRVLNTAMTRAKSQVIVIGDAVALCMFGKCSKIWKSYIEQCISHNNVHPPRLTKENIEQDVRVISKFARTEEDNSDTESSTSEVPDIEDPVLKELLDESNDACVTVNEEGLLDIISKDHSNDSGESQEPEEQSFQDHSEPSFEKTVTDYKDCVLFMEHFYKGFATPLNDPTHFICIKGRKNVGHSFPGDHVQVEVVSKENQCSEGKVVSILKRASPEKLYVCTIDMYDPQLMIPLNICVPKIYTPFWKDKPNYVAVRKFKDGHWKPEKFLKLNEELRREKLFVVRVLYWRERFRNPLGVVIDVLPKVTTLKEGLDVLDIENQLARSLPQSVQEEIVGMCFKEDQNRKDFRDYITFTVDPEGSKDLDDAISVRNLGKLYEIGIHISDVASFVERGSKTDNYAKAQGTAFYGPGKKPAFMFPESLSIDGFSLLPDCDRRAISLIVTVDKTTNQILKTKFFLSVICSNKQFSYEDAENVIRKSWKDPSYETVDGCLVVACCFSEMLRKDRMLADWCYESPDEDINVGERRSHIMIEELMVLFNSAVANRLLSSRSTKSLTPIRCQNKPNPEQIDLLKNRYSSLIPLSIHLFYHIADSDSCDANPNALVEQSQHLHSDSICILSTVLENLKLAACNKDIHRLIDLITTDDIHPELSPVAADLRKLAQKAHILRSNSTFSSKVGHSGLQLDSYTWASSPIRRYIDVVVQRILHSSIENTEINYTSKDIEHICLEFSQKNSQQKAYERNVYTLSTASELSKKRVTKVAFVVEASHNDRKFHLSFPVNRTSLPQKLPIMYRDLQLIDQPHFNEQNQSMTLKWIRRVYSFPDNQVISQPELHQDTTYISKEKWREILSFVRAENWQRVFLAVQDLGLNGTEATNNYLQTKTEHYTETSVELKVGKTLQVQLAASTVRGLLVPVVQLVIVNPHFDICLEHVKNPIECFSSYAVRSSKEVYATYLEFQKIWKPLCEMESASTAVAENDSIRLENVEVTLKRNAKGKHHGSFRLPLTLIKEWAIECDLSKCFLCIRLKDQIEDVDSVEVGPKTSCVQWSNLMDRPFYTWVAHGITYSVTDEDEAIKLTFVQVDFYINHLSMDYIPRRAFTQGTQFTVELIPKLLPDVRKEGAIASLGQANQLVKNIATGRRATLPASASKGWYNKISRHSSSELTQLNESQKRAIKVALENPFTLIQGPPGTGKTVVGVQLVYCFFTLNKENANSVNKTKQSEELRKKECILYCGPSNKSVDVVANQLLKFMSKLKPLRVYSEQMEMLEFPYPGSQLKLSRRSVREEKPNERLRSITLHHRIRMPENPFSNDILGFDLRIQHRMDITEKEVKSYKRLLNKARQHELLQHDVVLCTCTAASNPNFTKVLNIQQILIDECAMATEPEAFIPLVTHKPQQIVLIGDHKQLQPIVNCDLAKRLGMRKSLFERYMKQALMLDIQYRMHENICEFPSNEFYEGRLKTGVFRQPSVLLTKYKTPSAIIFGHIVGNELSLMVSTEKGNENSKANAEEAEQSVRIAWLLMNHCKIEPASIAILTPYNAQVAKLNEMLTEKGCHNVTVTTIMKSQGSEWRYVILSTVRSCHEGDIESEPTKSWLTKTLGFVMDPNQVNVGITRAQEGLCILGNGNLLRCSSLWRRLLNHYSQKGCVVDDAKSIQVQKLVGNTKPPTSQSNRRKK